MMQIGPYEVVKEIGRGGMGRVFRARGPDGREVAVKLLHRRELDALARFQRERRLLASLGVEHGFVPLLDAGDAPAGPWFSMPLLEGGTLREHLFLGPLPVDEVAALGRDLARALGAAHERGLIHRDMKPENVLYTRDRKPLIADLGIAKHFDQSAPGGSQSVALSGPGEGRGTVGYMAPEQILDARSVGPAADVFALGVILYEALIGEQPFAAPSPGELVAKLARGAFEPPRVRHPGAPAALVAAIEAALSWEAAKRPEDGRAFERLLAGSPAVAVSSAPPPGVERRGVLMGAALLTLLGLGVLALHRRRSEPPAPASAPSQAPSGPSKTDEARALARAAHARMAVRDMEGALREAERALALDRRCAHAYAVRSVVHDLKDDRRACIEDATRAIELDPLDALAWASRANARGVLGDFPGELEDATRAVALDPRSARSLFVRSGARAHKGDVEGALEDLNAAIAADPLFEPAWTNRAALRGERGDLDGQIEDATHAIEIAPDSYGGWSNRGIARLKKGDLASARSDLDRGIELNPREAMPFLARAEARRQLGDRSGASSDYAKFAELAPDDPLAAKARAMADELRQRR